MTTPATRTSEYPKLIRRGTRLGTAMIPNTDHLSAVNSEPFLECEREYVAERIESVWNALSGIPDPKKYVEAANGLRAVLETLEANMTGDEKSTILGDQEAIRFALHAFTAGVDG